MPLQATLTYHERAPDNTIIQGIAWPQHPRDPADPLLWGPPDAPIGHYPYYHPGLRLSIREHRRLTATFTYPKEAELVARSFRLPRFRALIPDWATVWESLSPALQESLRNCQHWSILENLKIRLNLIHHIPPYDPCFDIFLDPNWARPEELQNGRRAYRLRLDCGADHYADPAVKGIAILSKEKAKLGPGWKHDPFVAHYPGRRQRNKVTGKFTSAARTERVQKCPRCGTVLDNFDLPKSKPNKCPGTRTVNRKGKWVAVPCGEPLYTFGTPGPKVAHHLPNRFAHAQTIKSRNRVYVDYPQPHPDEPKPALHRWPLADLAVRYVKWGALIADEVHLYKGKGTDQGRAFHVLTSAARYTISLTGTIFGGKAPDLFYLLYRTSKEFRRAFRFNAEQHFTELYGRQERHLAPEETDRYGRTTGKRRREVSVKSIPGISPSIYRWCLPTMVITSLKDLHIPLPPYEEQIIRLDMAPFQAAQYRWVDKLLADKIKAGFASFDKQGMREAAALMAVYLQTTLSRPNSCFRTEEVWWKPRQDGAHAPYYVSRGASPIPPHMGQAFAHPATTAFDAAAFDADDLNLDDQAHEEEDFYGDAPQQKPTHGANGSRNGTHTQSRQARATDRSTSSTSSTPGVQHTPPPGMEVLTLHPAAPFEELLPKEQALLELVREEVRQGRRVLIYVRQTGTRDIQPRIQQVLKDAGIRASVLGAVEPTKREAWIDAQIAVGTQAVIVNPRKVETGLDLV